MSQPAPANRLLFHGKPVYLNGINVPWNNFGADFGCRYDERYFERMFRELRQYGVNSVRVWLHIDGRCQPVFAEGMTVGLTSRFYEHFDDFLARAQRYNIAVMPVLWSFDMTYEQTLRSSLITDVAKTNSYIEKALIPMVKRYAAHKALLAWEIINEPEWSIKETPCDAAKHDCVSLLQMQRFVGLQVAAIRANTTQYVTLGSAAFKWNADKGADVVGNWWSDAALVKASGKPNAGLSFYQVHYYEWQKAATYSFSPWDGRGPTHYLSDGKPVLMGELPAKPRDKWYTNREMLEQSYRLGYVGHMPWAYSSSRGDKEGSWEDIRDQLKAFRDARPAEVDLNLGR